jgi:hypothetical protein
LPKALWDRLITAYPEEPSIVEVSRRSSGIMARRTNDNKIATAVQLGDLSSSLTRQGDLGRRDRKDFLSFSLNQSRNFTLSLDGLTDNVDVALLNGRGRAIERSRKPGTQKESIAAPLAAGTYYIKITTRTTQRQIRYTLNLAVQNTGSEVGGETPGGASPPSTDGGSGGASPPTTDGGSGGASPPTTDGGSGGVAPPTTDGGSGGVAPKPTGVGTGRVDRVQGSTFGKFSGFAPAYYDRKFVDGIGSNKAKWGQSTSVEFSPNLSFDLDAPVYQTENDAKNKSETALAQNNASGRGVFSIGSITYFNGKEPEEETKAFGIATLSLDYGVDLTNPAEFKVPGGNSKYFARFKFVNTPNKPGSSDTSDIIDPTFNNQLFVDMQPFYRGAKKEPSDPVYFELLGARQKNEDGTYKIVTEEIKVPEGESVSFELYGRVVWAVQ